MKSAKILTATIFILLAADSAFAVSGAPGTAPSVAPAAPAPARSRLNLTELLTVAGPYQKFLSFLQSTNLTDTLENQANNVGITIFVPDNDAFDNLKNPSISNLTADQLKSLLLFHVLPQFYTFADFNVLSKLSPVETFAGGAYKLNIKDDYGTVYIYSSRTTAKITSTVLSTSPTSVYRIDGVLLPDAMFGPAPAPAPAGPASAPSPRSPASSPAPAPNSQDVTPPMQSPPAPPGSGDDSDDDGGFAPESPPTPSSASRRPGFCVLGTLLLSLWMIC